MRPETVLIEPTPLQSTKVKMPRMCHICATHVPHACLHICFTCVSRMFHACDTYVIHACHACVTGVSFHLRFTCVDCITQIPYFNQFIFQLKNKCETCINLHACVTCVTHMCHMQGIFADVRSVVGLTFIRCARGPNKGKHGVTCRHVESVPYV